MSLTTHKTPFSSFHLYNRQDEPDNGKHRRGRGGDDDVDEEQASLAATANLNVNGGESSLRRPATTRRGGKGKKKGGEQRPTTSNNQFSSRAIRKAHNTTAQERQFQKAKNSFVKLYEQVWEPKLFTYKVEPLCIYVHTTRTHFIFWVYFCEF